MIDDGYAVAQNKRGHAEEESSASISTLIERLTGFVRRQYRVFLIVTAAAVALGLVYLLITPAQYTATATLLIDSSTLRVLQNQLQPQGDIPLDALQVGSQVEILASRQLALTVVRDLSLADDADFVQTGRWFSRLFSHHAFDESSKADREERAVGEFLSHRSIARIERTYALDVSYTARNPVTAAKIANAAAEAYIDDQLRAKYQTIRRASAWLQDRIDELKAQVTSADRAVLEFKEKNKIVDDGGSSNRLIGEQQLFELNSQLAVARGATSEAKARLDRIEQVLKMDVSQAAVPDVLKNEVITRLRNQYLDLSAREANLAERYGSDHEAVINIRNQMEDLHHNIRAELDRIAASYQSDYEIAKTREENLEQELANQVSEGQVTNRDKLGLAELESSAKIYHTLYDSFLQRYMEAIQQQSFPLTDARVISAAVPPSRKSKPVGSLVLAVSITMGVIASLAIAVLREAIDSVFRTSRQAEQVLGVKCLSVIPLATAKLAPGRSVADPPDAGLSRATRLQPGPGPTPDVPHHVFADPLYRLAVDNPASVFTEAFRAIKITAWLRAATRDNRVIGITSTLPNEGKSTVACNLAALMADAGKRVILVDADLRNPTLVRSLAPLPSAGWMETLTSNIDPLRAIGQDPTTGLAFLPLLPSKPFVHSDEILSSQAFRDLIDQLRRRYDYVVMDLPPIAPVVDVRAVLPVIDSFVYVVEWGSTRINAVRHHLTAMPELQERLLGVVLNKVNLKVLESFEEKGLYQNGYYANGAEI